MITIATTIVDTKATHWYVTVSSTCVGVCMFIDKMNIFIIRIMEVQSFYNYSLKPAKTITFAYKKLVITYKPSL